MEPCTGWVGEHIQDIAPLLPGDGGIFFGSEGLVILPVLLPFCFYLCKRVFAHGRYISRYMVDCQAHDSFAWFSYGEINNYFKQY